jgi:large subunit ribosomal protein L10
MSKYVKDLVTSHIRQQLSGVSSALLVDVSRLPVVKNVQLRKHLREKNIRLMVVKNSLARRATAGSPLAAAFEGLQGSAAVLWGGEDIVSLAKEVVKLQKNPQFANFTPLGGAMDGSKLSKAEIEQVSKWPTRQEQLSMLVGQILGPGARLAAQILGPGGALASQIKQKAEAQAEPAEGSPAPAA